MCDAPCLLRGLGAHRRRSLTAGQNNTRDIEASTCSDGMCEGCLHFTTRHCDPESKPPEGAGRGLALCSEQVGWRRGPAPVRRRASRRERREPQAAALELLYHVQADQDIYPPGLEAPRLLVDAHLHAAQHKLHARDAAHAFRSRGRA